MLLTAASATSTSDEPVRHATHGKVSSDYETRSASNASSAAQVPPDNSNGLTSSCEKTTATFCSNGGSTTSSGFGCQTEPQQSSSVLAHLVQSLETHLPSCLLENNNTNSNVMQLNDVIGGGTSTASETASDCVSCQQQQQDDQSKQQMGKNGVSRTPHPVI